MRNLILSISKFCFVVMIVCLHCFIPYKNAVLFKGAYIFADFFFVLQGFYLAPYIENGDNRPLFSIRKYVEKFYKKYFIIVLFQAFLFCGHHAVISLLHKLSLEENVIEFLVQVTFISALLPHNMLANGSLWFLSAYLFGGVLAIWLYSMARNQKIMLATIIAVCAYNYIIISNGNVDVWFQNTAFVQFALIRAVGGISSGIVTFYIYEEVKCCNLSVLQLFVSRLIIFMAFATMVFYAWSGGHSALDIFIISLFSIFILCANLPQNYIKSGKTASFLESHAIPIYIFQQFIIDFTGHFMGRDIYRIIIVLIIDILVAILWSYFETSVLRITRLK